MDRKRILVVGAGPTGLATAIFLTEGKQDVRIIDKLDAPAGHSKAMAINPRSLELLEKSEVTSTLLEEGREIRYIRLRTPTKSLAVIDLKTSGHRYGYMLGLPQSETERILEEKLNSLGVQVERGVEFTSFRETADSVECELKKEGNEESYTVDFLVGANGARSNIRKQLGARFDGKTLPGKWHLADVRMSSDSGFGKSLSQDSLHMTFLDNGFLFAVSFKPGVYRVASNQPSVFECLPTDAEVEKVEWESSFKINQRLTSQYAKGRVALAGDAAHVHSPIGGRGMNLGIEDAAYLASAITSGDLQGYNSSRRRAASRVIRLVDLQTKIALGNNIFVRLTRRFMAPIVLSIPSVQRGLVRRFTGLHGSAG